MRLLVIVGSQLRHQYFLSVLAKNFELEGVIEFSRTLVQPPKLGSTLFSQNDLNIEKIHLENLDKKEKEYFSKEVQALDKSSLNIKKVINGKELNSQETLEWVKKLNVDVVIDYGSGILSDDFLDILPKWCINLHGGLSPYFKGSATLLWPFYMQQPELAGVTFHLLTKNIDGGDIIQHVRPKMQENDSVSDIGCKAIIEASEAGVKLLTKLKKEGNLELFPQKGGKLFLEKDYKPSCIQVVNTLFKNGLIKNYLKNKKTIDAQYNFIDQLSMSKHEAV